MFDAALAPRIFLWAFPCGQDFVLHFKPQRTLIRPFAVSSGEDGSDAGLALLSRPPGEAPPSTACEATADRCASF